MHNENFHQENIKAIISGYQLQKLKENQKEKKKP